MDKMRWFIIGNLIGFGVLLGGIALNDSFRQHASEPYQSDAKSSYGKDSVVPPATSAVPAQPSDSTTQSPPPQSTGVNTGAAQSDTAAIPATAAKNDEAGIELITRVVTARDISKGTILHPGDIELRKIDKKRSRPNGLSTVESAFGQKTRTDLIEGEMLEPGDLDKP